MYKDTLAGTIGLRTFFVFHTFVLFLISFAPKKKRNHGRGLKKFTKNKKPCFSYKQTFLRIITQLK